MSDIKVDNIAEAIEDIRNGKMIIVVDDEDRENEGDFIIAARHATPEVINFMATHGRGLICAALTEERCNELELNLMVGSNTALHATAFTVSVDLLRDGVTTGISASDRSKTVLALIDPESKAQDFGRPGHIFPLKAKAEGVLRRTGHTEATVDLARLAGCEPAGVLVEIMNADGSMARLPELRVIADQFGLKLITIKDLIEYRLKHDSLIVREIGVDLPTYAGDFDLIAYRQLHTDEIHLALIKGQWEKDEPVLVRVHSSCVTGDIFGSCRCDCGEQLLRAMEMVEQEGKGVILYMNQEGRGIGIINKLKAYNLQDRGLNTVDANIHLGLEVDARRYGIALEMLKDLKVGRIRLLTNNPDKIEAFENAGIELVDRIPLVILPHHENRGYLETKQKELGHLFDLI